MKDWTATRMSLNGNIILLLDARETRFRPSASALRGLAVLDKNWHQLIAFRGTPQERIIDCWNKDGSRALNCVNGAMCMAEFLGVVSGERQQSVRFAGRRGAAYSTHYSPAFVDVQVSWESESPVRTLWREGAANYRNWGDNIDGCAFVKAARFGNHHVIFGVDGSKESPEWLAAAMGSEKAKKYKSIHGADANITFAALRGKMLHIATHENGSPNSPACGSAAYVARRCFAPAEIKAVFPHGQEAGYTFPPLTGNATIMRHGGFGWDDTEITFAA